MAVPHSFFHTAKSNLAIQKIPKDFTGLTMLNPAYQDPIEMKRCDHLPCFATWFGLPPMTWGSPRLIFKFNTRSTINFR